MSDSGNIDISGKFNAIQAGKLAKPNANSVAPSEPGVSSNNRLQEIKTENRARYKDSTNAQSDLVKKQLTGSSPVNDPNQNLKEALKSTNPVLSAKLDSGKVELVNNKKNKKTPPQPSAKIGKKNTGQAINPRRIKPSMPGRLKSFFDDRTKKIDKLAEVLKTDEKPKIDKIKTLSKNIFEQSFDFQVSESLAQKLNLTEELFTEDINIITATLMESAELLNSEPELKEFYLELVNQIVTLPANQMIVPFFQLFLPLPFSFVFADLDEEFDEDEQEHYDDSDGFFNEEEEDDDEEDDKNYKSTLSMSIKTINYNKLYFIIKHNPKSAKLKVAIKASPIATELAIPIESNLEDILVDEIDDVEYHLRLWRENVLRVTETRILKVKSTGRLDPVILKACNSILNTICESDIDLSDESLIEADYNII